MRLSADLRGTKFQNHTPSNGRDKEVESRQETARVLATITTAIGRCLEPEPSRIGKRESSKDEDSTTFQISFTKDGPLDLSLKGQPGRMLVLAVQPESFFEKWNRAHPESTVEKGDYLLEAQGWVNLAEVLLNYCCNIVCCLNMLPLSGGYILARGKTTLFARYEWRTHT